MCVCVCVCVYSCIYTHKMFLCKSAKGETYAYITVDRVFLEDSHKKSLTVVGSRIEGSLTFLKKTHREKYIKINNLSQIECPWNHHQGQERSIARTPDPLHPLPNLFFP